MEIRYNKKTKEVTGWWLSRFNNHEIKLSNRPNEIIVNVNTNVPGKSLPLNSWLFNKDTQSMYVK